MFHQFLLYFTVFVCTLSSGYALNLTLTDYHNPAANHILDAEVVDDVLIISAMVQGIEFYNNKSGDYKSNCKKWY